MAKSQLDFPSKPTTPLLSQKEGRQIVTLKTQRQSKEIEVLEHSPTPDKVVVKRCSSIKLDITF